MQSTQLKQFELLILTHFNLHFAHQVHEAAICHWWLHLQVAILHDVDQFVFGKPAVNEDADCDEFI